MQKSLVIVGLAIVFVLGGCSARPISKTWHHTKRVYNATKQVYNASKAVAEVVNPLEYIYVSEQGHAVTPDGEPFVTGDAIIESPTDLAE